MGTVEQPSHDHGAGPKEKAQAPERRAVHASLDPRGASGMLLQLQRTAGNAAVNRLLRQVQTPRSGGLRDGAVAHVPRPVPGTGAAKGVGNGEAVVQRQETGIAAAASLQGVGSEIQALIDDATWVRLTPENRARAMMESGSTRLEALGGPRITHLFGQQGVTEGGSQYGAFMPATGMVILNEGPFKDGSSREERIGAAGTVYHEVRHAEQFYRVARLMAGEGIPANDIHERLGLAEGFVKKAGSSPLRKPKGYGEKHKSEEKRVRDTEYTEAVEWAGVVDKSKGREGKSSIYQEVSERMNAAQKEYGVAQAKLRNAKSDLEQGKALVTQGIILQEDLAAAQGTYDTCLKAFRMAWTTYKGLYKAYHMTPVESDAWRVGGRMEGFLGGTPNSMEQQLRNLPGNPEQHTFEPTMEPVARPSRRPDRRAKRMAGQFSPPSGTEDTIQTKHVQRHAMPEEIQEAMKQDEEIAGLLEGQH